MKNRRSATGVGAGELSEYLLSQAILEKHCGIEPAHLHQQILASSGDGENRITITGDTGERLDYRYDGKTLEAVREYSAHLETPNELVLELQEISADVAPALHIPSGLREVRALGGSGGKADLTLLGQADTRPVGLSLKYQHHASTRYQSPSWTGVVRAYRSIGADISDQRSTYLDAHRQFMTPHLRFSRERGDYTAQLRAGCDAIVAAHHQLNLLLQAQPDRIDRAALAEGILRGYTGGAYDMHLIDMSDGTVLQLHNHTHHKLRRVLEGSDLQISAERSESGRTLKLKVSADGREVVRLQTTASTNRARGQGNPDLRTPKPQTYHMPDLAMLADLQPGCGET